MEPSLLQSKDYQQMIKGEIYSPAASELAKARYRCAELCIRLNEKPLASRREKVELWRNIIRDERPLPPLLPNPADDEAQFTEDPNFDVPMIVDYGFNFKVGQGSYLNRGLLVLDTCKVTIGAKVLLGPNVSLYTACHPIDAAVRNRADAPEFGKEIHIEDECWIGGNVVICPGVRIGRCSTVGAGSVVTKDVPPYVVVGGNPARVLKTLSKSADERV